ncbi:hypothetical protein AGDE_13184 [Angomonas deanei]|uniref:Uncharacterized protein n=1 Tax=Angomonas deanei TaxID=59799 RepID=A0A7G2CR52_9TRYP|nr:hypothetical protein AGDE_13184 [Angomonas deanei]CAD2221464.1 hypothetical protein, conserved [Angomonas deanei]|eukprot:EPY22627.1 hypothetical protein AGDE_13184 [Angomonas deanei]
MENVSDQLFLIDFGLSCPLSASIGDTNAQQNVNEHCQKELFNPRKKPLIGTMQFASLNTHEGVPHHYRMTSSNYYMCLFMCISENCRGRRL